MSGATRLILWSAFFLHPPAYDSLVTEFACNRRQFQRPPSLSIINHIIDSTSFTCHIIPANDSNAFSHPFFDNHILTQNIPWMRIVSRPKFSTEKRTNCIADGSDSKKNGSRLFLFSPILAWCDLYIRYSYELTNWRPFAQRWFRCFVVFFDSFVFFLRRPPRPCVCAGEEFSRCGHREYFPVPRKKNAFHVRLLFIICGCLSGADGSPNDALFCCCCCGCVSFPSRLALGGPWFAHSLRSFVAAFRFLPHLWRWDLFFPLRFFCLLREARMELR